MYGLKIEWSGTTTHVQMVETVEKVLLKTRMALIRWFPSTKAQQSHYKPHLNSLGHWQMVCI